MYTKFFDKILNSYKKIGFRPQPKVFLCAKEKMCSPLVAIALAENGENSFKLTSGSYNSSALHRWITKYLKGNWIWVEGFHDAFNLNEPAYWKNNTLQYTHYIYGQKVGIEIRNKLKEIYYKKPNPE